MDTRKSTPAGGIRGRQGLPAVQGAPAGEADAGESSLTCGGPVAELVYSAEGDVTPIGDLPAGEADRLEHLEAVIADRILKPGGSALFYVGQSILPDVLDVVRPHLRYWWTAATLHAGAANLLNRLGIRCTFKPILWLVKETRGEVSRIVHDTASSPREKDLHPWQQGLGDAEHFISALCPEGGTVVDFFAGSGTTATAARRLGRRFVTLEVDPATAAVAAERLRGVP